MKTEEDMLEEIISYKNKWTFIRIDREIRHLIRVNEKNNECVNSTLRRLLRLGARVEK
jgi:nicotinamidase-related amidase